MKSIFVIALTLPLISSNPVHEITTNQVPKKASTFKEPYQVSLRKLNGNHFCSGTIVTQSHVMTASHCMEGQDLKAVSVRAGSAFLSTGGQSIAVKSIKTPSCFNGPTYLSNLAILELVSPIELNLCAGTSIIGLADQDPAPGTVGLVTGWGKIGNDSVISERLMKINVPIISRTDCQNAYPEKEITSRMICTSKLQGDLGAPLVINGFLAGIASFGDDGLPGVYTNIASYSNWVLENM